MEVYLDNSATTRCYTEVGELVYKVMCQDYGNPSSMHRKGVDAEHYIKDAKEILAKISEGQCKRKFILRPAVQKVTIWRSLEQQKANKERKSSDHIIYRASGDFRIRCVIWKRKKAFV